MTQWYFDPLFRSSTYVLDENLWKWHALHIAVFSYARKVFSRMVFWPPRYYDLYRTVTTDTLTMVSWQLVYCTAVCWVCWPQIFDSIFCLSVLWLNGVLTLVWCPNTTVTYYIKYVTNNPPSIEKEHQQNTDRHWYFAGLSNFAGLHRYYWQIWVIRWKY